MKTEARLLEETKIGDADIQPAAIVKADSDSNSLMRLIERAAFSPDVDAAKLGALLDVKERWEAGEAKKAYNRAMTQFKANPPIITKNKRVKFGTTDFWHTSLDHACELIIPALSAVGITHRYKTVCSEKTILVTCILTHEQGHSEETTLPGMPDTSGSKNAIQAVGSTVTYLERYTLLAATGLATEGMDNDGNDGAAADESLTRMSGLDDWIEKFKECSTAEEFNVQYGKAWNAAVDAKDEDAKKKLSTTRDEYRNKFRSRR